MGLIRLYLALSVLCFHIGVNKGFPFVPAGEAVYAFFILSGFYISLGLNERYSAPGSNTEFYLSRLVRLWPAYLISLAFMYSCGVLQQVFRLAMDLPPVVAGFAIFSNVTMLGLDLLTHFSLVDGHVQMSEWGFDPHQNGVNYVINLPAWSLAVELVFYASAPFIVRSFKRSMAFLAVGMLYWIAIRFNEFAPISVFNPKSHYPYYMLYFGLGSAAYWLNRLYPKDWKIHTAFAFSMAAVMNLLMPSFAVGYTLLALATPHLFQATKNNLTDRFLGDLAYPVYVLQVPVGAAIRAYGPENPSALLNFIVIMTVSVIVLLLVERPIDKLKSRMMRNKRRINRPANCTSSATSCL